MVTLLPLDGSFIRFAGRFVDEAWGVAAGYNYFLAQAGFVCFELTIFNTIIGYVSHRRRVFSLSSLVTNFLLTAEKWNPDVNPAITISALLATYFILNIWSVGFFGESEFWLSLGKVALILMLILYTFITMVGGNPLRDAYGFRYWKDPGPMAEYIHTGALGRFQGFLACLIGAAFTFSGPEYISMVAGEA
jgi:amino acid transporter